jgi:hypothetical protein
MVRQRQAAGHESQRVWVGSLGRPHFPTPLERLAKERVHAGWPIDR